MSVPEDIDGLVNLDNLARGASLNFQKELSRVAADRSPFQLGKATLVTGWSYRGKTMIVDKISARFLTLAGAYRLEVQAEGFVLSTAGQPTKNRAHSDWTEVHKNAD